MTIENYKIFIFQLNIFPQSEKKKRRKAQNNQRQVEMRFFPHIWIHMFVIKIYYEQGKKNREISCWSGPTQKSENKLKLMKICGNFYSCSSQ